MTIDSCPLDDTGVPLTFWDRAHIEITLRQNYERTLGVRIQSVRLGKDTTNLDEYLQMQGETINRFHSQVVR